MELSIIGHLAELRKRIIFSLLFLLLAIGISSPFIEAILELLRRPANGVIDELAFFSPQEVAVVYIKIAIFSGIIISLPFLLYQAWRFVLPALEGGQRRHCFGFVFSASLAFILGASFAYFYLLPLSLKFLLSLGGSDLRPVISLSKYLSFVLALILGCALVFQMPVLIWMFSRLRLITPRMLREKRKYAIALILITAAIITPTTDPFNMFLLAVPMLILYEISIGIAYFSRRNR